MKTVEPDVLIFGDFMIVWLNRVSMEVIETCSERLNIRCEEEDGCVRVRGTQQELWAFLHSLSGHYGTLTIE